MGAPQGRIRGTPPPQSPPTLKQEPDSQNGGHLWVFPVGGEQSIHSPSIIQPGGPHLEGNKL